MNNPSILYPVFALAGLTGLVLLLIPIVRIVPCGAARSGASISSWANRLPCPTPCVSRIATT